MEIVNTHSTPVSTSVNKPAHETVLLHEAVDALLGDKSGRYIDCTFGRGGHTSLMLSRLDSDAHVMVFDQDRIAYDLAMKKASADARLIPQHCNFSKMLECVAAQGWQYQVDGILMDLGVSSPQLDEAERGFSFMKDGPLDMRMDTSRGQTAAQWLLEASKEEIADVLWHYGDERQSRKIASAIVMDREKQPFETTLQLANLIERIMPASPSKKGKTKHPATRTFQAIRIFINDELTVLKKALEDTPHILKEGGRLVVISFHSLEDRLVKQFVRGMSHASAPRGMPVIETKDFQFKALGKPVKPSAEEVEHNTRSRSAIMRIAVLKQPLRSAPSGDGVSHV